MKNIILAILVIFGTKFNLLFATEAFLPGDLPKFKNTGENVRSEHLNRSGHLYICDEKNFNDLFPQEFLDDKYKDHSNLVGQIEDKYGNGIGSGTLFDIKQEGNTIVGTGFTALHVFCSLNETNGLKIDKNCSFIIGRKAIQNNPDESSFVGHIDIKHVLIQKDIPKDICLFRGQITYKTDVFNSSADFIKFFNRHKPTLIDQDLTLSLQNADMYHYPAGKKDLRINTGQLQINTNPLQDEKTHSIRTLSGSSGAAIFSFDLIVGIHIGQQQGVADTTKIVRYFPPLKESWWLSLLPESWKSERADYQDFTIMKSPKNKFEIFSEKDYDDFILQNIDLYNLNISQKNNLHITILRKI